MVVIPVIDILQGVVVRGVAGQRSKYQPVRSRITTKTDPYGVADAFRRLFGCTHIYVADLDAIMHQAPNTDTIRRLVACGFTPLVDVGVRDEANVKTFLDCGVTSVVIALETCPGPEFIDRVVGQFDSQHIVFSLDLSHNRPLTTGTDWCHQSAFAIACDLINRGIRRIIVLDLAGVGVSQGVSTRDLCQQLRNRFPQIEITTGGGVRHRNDLDQLADIGVDQVLVASALHDGTLNANDVEAFRRKAIDPPPEY